MKYDSRSGILDIISCEKYIRTVTENAGMGVVFKDGLKVPYTNRKTIYLPRLNGDITKDDIEKLRGYVLHETLHHTKGPLAFDIGEKAFKTKESKKSPLAALLNIVEDERIERAGAKEYRGDAQIIDNSWSMSFDNAEKDIAEALKSDDPDATRFIAAWEAELRARSEWCPSANKGLALINKHMTPELQKLIDKTDKAGIIDKIHNLSPAPNGSQQAFDLAKEMYELYFEKSAEEHLKEVNKPQPGEGEEGGEGTEGQKGKGKGKGKGEGKEGEGEGAGNGELGQPKGDGDPKGKPSGAKVNYRVFESSPTSEMGSGSGSGIHLDYTKYLEERKHHPTIAFIPNPNVKVKYYRSGRRSTAGNAGDGDRRGQEDQVIEHRARHGQPGKGFGNKIRQLLQIKSQAKYVGGQKKGKLHLKNLYRGGMPSESYSKRVFRQKFTNDTLDTVVTVLTDLSGSMGGRKVINAIESAILLNDSIARSLRMPVEILGFTDDYDSSIVAVIKEFEQQLGSDDVLKNFSKATSYMNSNADGEAIQWAYDRIKSRKEKRKILIVISDGSPACCRGGDIYEYTEKVIRQIEGEGVVELYAIGIEDHTVEELYKQHVVINDSRELENSVLNLIKRSIFK